MQIQQQLTFLIFHFSFNLKNFYLEFSKGVGHKNLKHILTEFVTISFNAIKTQNLNFQYYVNYKLI